MSIKVYNVLTYRTMDSIKPYENNARENEKAIEELVKQIPISGFNVPIVIDKNGVIVKGHSRYEALKRLGVTMAPCIMIDGTPEEIDAERLSDNKLSELATWDDLKLKFELREIPVSLTGFEKVVTEAPVQGKKGEPEDTLEQAVKPSIPKDVTVHDVERAEQKLVTERETAAERRQLVPILCTHCGETFMVNQEEIEKYGK